MLSKFFASFSIFPFQWQTTCSHCGDKRPPPVETPVSPPPVLPIKETIPICTLYFLPHLFWPPPTPQPLPPLPWQPRTCLCHLHLHPAHSLAAPACPRRAPMRPICMEAPEALTHLLALFTSWRKRRVSPRLDPMAFQWRENLVKALPLTFGSFCSSFCKIRIRVLATSSGPIARRVFSNWWTPKPFPDYGDFTKTNPIWIMRLWVAHWGKYLGK